MWSVVNATLLPLYPQKREQLPLLRGMVGPRAGWMEWGKSLSPPSGFDPLTAQPVASRPTDWAVAAYFCRKSSTVLSSHLPVSLFSFHGYGYWAVRKKWERGREACACLVVKPDRKRTLVRQRRKWKYNIKIMWTELIWHWIGTSNELWK